MTSKKKILVFIDWFLPGYKAGGPIQSCANLIEHLKDEFDFSVVTRDTDYCEIHPYTSIKRNEWNDINGTSVYYLSQERLNRKTIKAILEREKYDVVYLNGIYSLYFSLLPLYYLKKINNKKVIIAARGMFAQSAISVKKSKKQLFLRTAKVIGWFKNVVFHATTSDEAEDIKFILGNNTEVKVAPNLPKKVLSEFIPRNKEKGELKLISIARISPEKNLKYALQILAKVQRKVEFDIYGPVYDVQYWNECKTIITDMHPNVSIRYMESLPSDQVEEVLRNYHFLFLPTQGENFGHIILEALGMGCPVIISDQTPWKNLEEKKAGWDISLNNKTGFLELIDQCVSMDSAQYRVLSEAAYDFANKYKNNPIFLKANRELFS